MPMWLYKRRPTPPQPTAPSTTPAAPHDALMGAIARDDVNGARGVFEKAFWDKTEFRPDGYHLMIAVKRGNRDMIRLLATHGSAWTEEETKVARLICGPASWSAAESELKRAGIRTQFGDAELKGVDPFAVTAWARRNVEYAEHLGLPEAKQARLHLEKLVYTGACAFVSGGDFKEAVKLLQAGGAAFGNGAQANPYDVAPIVEVLATFGAKETASALAFLDDLAAQGLSVKPIRLRGVSVWTNPALLKELDARGILSPEQGLDRMILLHNWSFVQKEINTSAGVINLGEDFVATQNAALRLAAEVLFQEGKPLSPAEADHFMLMHEGRVKQTPEALARMETALLDLGFFGNGAFTVQQLKNLADTAPGNGNLRDRFNKLASARLIADQGPQKFLSPAKFHEIETAHRLRAWRAEANDVTRILDYLSSQVKKDTVPDGIVSSLKTLRDGGADFSKVDPNKYLGKRAPGLCKALVDLGLVTARAVDVEKLAQRNNGELRPLTPRTAPDWADQEFMCQIILESAAPEKYVPLRGKDGVSYQQQFIREYAVNMALKRRFMSYKRRPGGTGSSGPR